MNYFFNSKTGGLKGLIVSRYSLNIVANDDGNDYYNGDL